MNWGKAVGYGVVLYAIMFLIASILMFGLKLTGDVFGVTMLVISASILWVAAGRYQLSGSSEGMRVGVVWLVVEAALDYLLIVQIFNKGSLSVYTWSLLTAYVLIVAIPTLVGQMAKK
jgi:hypothetical protein